MPWDPRYEPVIGLEVHAQLLTGSKTFCGCSTTFGADPNSNVCPVCLGLPGVLPVLNRRVVEFAVRMGLATHCSVAHRSLLARKNYFYPDLPKGYQISQYEEPICSGGWIEIPGEDGTPKRIGITRIHIEEDAGKSIHDQSSETLVDVNRCGVPLIEIVSEPDLRSPREAASYMSRIHQLVTYLGICDGTMEEGSLRCDANVSVRLAGSIPFGTKTEVKNMNSFRFVEKAIEFEINRQIDLISAGTPVVQQTLLWDSERAVCVPMRTKEAAHDYRYFPDPDLVPIVVEDGWIGEVRASLPELPDHRRMRYQSEFKLPVYDAEVLTAERPVADYFEAIVKDLRSATDAAVKLASNWTMTDLLRVAKERAGGLQDFPVSARHMAEMIDLLVDGTISSKIAKQVFEEMLATGEAPKEVVTRKELLQVSDAGAIEPVIDEILQRSQMQIAEYRAGKLQVYGYFVGETMKAMKGKANPNVVNEILQRKLNAIKES